MLYDISEGFFDVLRELKLSRWYMQCDLFKQLRNNEESLCRSHTGVSSSRKEGWLILGGRSETLRWGLFNAQRCLQDGYLAK